MTIKNPPIGTAVQGATVHVPASEGHTVVSQLSPLSDSRSAERVSWRAWIVGGDGQPL